MALMRFDPFRELDRLEYVEQVRGPMDYGTAARCGAYAGALIGWIFGLFNWIEPLTAALVLAGYGLAFGAIVGASFGLLVHALQLLASGNRKE